MLILALETSAISASCAVLEDEKVIAEYFVNNKLTHSKTIMPMVENMLKTAEVDMGDIDLFAVGAGPGSFTGVRIGIATLKGLAAPFDKPCVGVSTLEAMAQNLAGFNGIICSVMDARCEQVYNALFESDGKQIKRLCEDRAISIEELKNNLETFSEKDVILVGDGADLCYNILYIMKNSKVAPTNIKYQRAFGVAILAKRLFDEGNFSNVDTLKPTYLRLSQAERNLNNA
jgi:tRNA threonylcarbamoyladenosine biosynthesis protein TsaB